MNIDFSYIASAILLLIVILASWFAYLRPGRKPERFHEGGFVNPSPDVYRDFANQIYGDQIPPLVHRKGQEPVVVQANRRFGKMRELASPYGRRKEDGPTAAQVEEKRVNAKAFIEKGEAIAVEAMGLLDQRSKRCAAYLLTALTYMKEEEANSAPSAKPLILVRREDMERWREDYLNLVGANESDVDIVTPFDHYFYG